MDVSWDDARLFLAVSETGSFSAAAKRLALGQPTISRRIADLEYRLGYALFHRGKSGAELTSEAVRLVPAAREMARWAAEFERCVAGNEQRPSGTVRLAAPPGVAFELLVAVCEKLKRELPALNVEILASMDFLDLARGDADLAVRTLSPTEPELVCVGSYRVPVAAFATPAYVSSLPDPCSLADVGWITSCFPYLHVPPRPQLEALIPNFKPAFASDNYLVQQRACELGLGAAILADFTHPLRRLMGLKRVPLRLPFPDSETFLVSPKSLQSVPRVRAVTDALMREFNQIRPGKGTL